MRIEDLKEKTKEAEDLTDHQTEQEDKYDERLRRMHEARVSQALRKPSWNTWHPIERAERGRRSRWVWRKNSRKTREHNWYSWRDALRWETRFQINLTQTWPDFTRYDGHVRHVKKCQTYTIPQLFTTLYSFLYSSFFFKAFCHFTSHPYVIYWTSENHGLSLSVALSWTTLFSCA